MEKHVSVSETEYQMFSETKTQDGGCQLLARATVYQELTVMWMHKKCTGVHYLDPPN